MTKNEQIVADMQKCWNCSVEWSRCDPGKCFAVDGVCFGCGEALQENDERVCQECVRMVQEEENYKLEEERREHRRMYAQDWDDRE